jgi:YidC/Oxa1 family membrane protein insertase
VAPPAAAPAASVAPPPDEPELTALEEPGLWRAKFSRRGAAPVEFTLLHPQYKRGKDVPIDLVNKPGVGLPPYLVHFGRGLPESDRSDFELPLDAAWRRISAGPKEIVYAIDVGSVHIEKAWRVPGPGYRLDLVITVENRGSQPVNQHLIFFMPGYHDPSVEPPSALSFGRRVELTYGLCHVKDKLRQMTLVDALEKPLTEVGDVRWIGTGEQFFLAAAAFAPEPEGRTCNVYAEASGRITARAVFPKRTLAPGQRVEVPVAAYLGPKLTQELEAVTVAGENARLKDAVDYTLPWLARPMLWVLQKIQSVTKNWGLAIIVITLLLKILLFYPTHKSMQSAKQMAALKPDLERLKEKFGDDKAAFNQAQMELFKQRGINPLGGCLPMVLQMPIYIAFYSMLSNAVELYRASFVGPIRDMTDSYWPLALGTGALMFLQQKISPMSPDSQQQKMMLYMMPVMFMLFTLMLPSGLVLYIFTNTLLSMGQQWMINRSGGGMVAAPAPRGTKGPKTPKKGKDR